MPPAPRHWRFKRPGLAAAIVSPSADSSATERQVCLQHGHSRQPQCVAQIGGYLRARQFTVDAMGAALMISEFARRHIAR